MLLMLLIFFFIFEFTNFEIKTFRLDNHLFILLNRSNRNHSFFGPLIFDLFY